jgi:hypothetical protein
MTAPKVFLSHTSRMARLPEGRSFVQAALDAIAQADVFPRDMRFFTADDRTPAEVCIDAVRRCDVYVGIFGLDYGSPVRDRPDVSYTELEFLTALEERQKCGMRLFALLLDEKLAPESLGPMDSRQAAFRQRVKDSGLTAAYFATPDRLEMLVHRTLKEQLGAPPRLERRLQHLPYLPANFTGRYADLDAAERLIRDALAAGAALSLVGFKGMGGVGKSTLAAALADRLSADPRLFPGGVLWANLLDKEPEDVARDWLRDLGKDVSGLTSDQCLTRFHELAAERRPLVVLDNVPRAERGDSPAAKLLVRAQGVATLLTTRFREAVPGGVPVREVEALPAEEALALLRTHVGGAADADPASAEAVLEQCGRLPLFVKAAGRAVANGYYSLAEYAQELREHGLAALVEEDEKAAAVFDLSWRSVGEAAREVFAALALAPGEEVGPNLAAAWLRQGGGQGGRSRPARLLAELANAALLIPADERARRYRYHDRVRDYALGKLTLPREQVRRRLMACYADWDMVRAEFAAVGPHELAAQYQRLRGAGADEPADFAAWHHFVLAAAGRAPGTAADFAGWSPFFRLRTLLLREYPELLFQQASNEPAESPVSRAVRNRLGTPEEPERWLEWVNRPQASAPPDPAVLRDQARPVSSVAVTANGRSAVSGSWDRTVRVWDLADGRCVATHAAESEVAGKAWAMIQHDAFTADIEPRGLTLRSATDGAVLARFPGTFTRAACSADGCHVVAGDGWGGVYILRLHTRPACSEHEVTPSWSNV